MGRQFKLTIMVTVIFLSFAVAVQANLNALEFLGQVIDAPVQSNTAIGGQASQQMNYIQGPNGSRPVNFPLYSHKGQQYAAPQDFSQIFPGTSVQQQGNNYSFNRGQQRLNVVIIMRSVIIIFMGMQIDSGYQTHQQGNNTYLPINGIGQYFGQQFQQSGNGLIQSQNNAVQASWQQFLNQNGGQQYTNQIQNSYNQTTNGQSPTGQVFRDITATVFDSVETGQKGAYGHHLSPNDYFVALPKRFSGTRPKVAVKGPNGKTVVAEVKDVGPWNINDPYWETGSRPQAETGRDKRGRRTNLAGIDLSPRIGREIGLNGKGKVDWWFVR